MAKRLSHYARARRTLLWILLASTLVFILGSVVLVMYRGDGSQMPPSDDPSPDLLTIGSLVATVTSCLTSIATFVGFVSTTILAWRKEKREAAAAELEMQRQGIELERTRLELEKLKRTGTAQDQGE